MPTDASSTNLSVSIICRQSDYNGNGLCDAPRRSVKSVVIHMRIFEVHFPERWREGLRVSSRPSPLKMTYSYEYKISYCYVCICCSFFSRFYWWKSVSKCLIKTNFHEWQFYGTPKQWLIPAKMNYLLLKMYRDIRSVTDSSRIPCLYKILFFDATFESCYGFDLTTSKGCSGILAGWGGEWKATSRRESRFLRHRDGVKILSRSVKQSWLVLRCFCWCIWCVC